MQLVVDLNERSYPIYIATGLFSNSSSFKLTSGQRVFIITNNIVAPLYLAEVTSSLQKSGCQVDTFIVPDGEMAKSLSTLDTVFTELLKQNHGRDTTIVALGGGVIGDLAGFAAATYQRGIPFIQVPTTLLAQVDSSVGGKTGINHPLGKNMIGAFYQPQSVVIDLNCLKTLPKREFYAGLAEVIKYGIILDAEFFAWLETHLDDLLNYNEAALAYCIERCCRLKSEVVTADEKELGARALLNLGHTFGHAIETELGYGVWLHGEAVSVGMVMAAQTACLLEKISAQDVDRIQLLLQRAQLPIKRPANMTVKCYFPHMLRDKKVLGGKLRLILPDAIGRAGVYDNVPSDVIENAIIACS